jgi:mRNA-decapping enzyme subunit 2
MPATTNSFHQNSGLHWIPLSVLDDLAVRFLINLLDWEKTDLIRICFQIELAHWFFIDFIIPQHPEGSLSEGTISEFSAHMFNHVPFLRKFSHQVDTILEYWRIYKNSVPVRGAIMLNQARDKVLLVKGYGNKASWTFPKGKINEEEEEHNCAVREVLEETSYDISQLIQQDLYLEKVVSFKTVRLFLVAGVEEEFNFQPRVRGEIQEIRWWNLDQLPQSMSDKQTKQRLGVGLQQLFTTIPFIRDVRLWADLCPPHSPTTVIESGDCKRSEDIEDLECFIPNSWSNFQLDMSDIESCYEDCSSNLELENSLIDQVKFSSSQGNERSPGY